MAHQPRTATRASARTKTNTSAPQPTTRSTRSKTAAAGQASSSPAVVPADPTTKKMTGRKPLVQRNNSPEQNIPTSKLTSKSGIIPRKATNLSVQENEREPIMAYLRIRPKLNEDEDESSPYLTQLSDTSVRMTDPQDHQANPSRFRPSTIPPSSTYMFSHIFPHNTSQSQFFQKTTLPIVRDALHGQNGLIFTYGVTNSGKTYTVQGGSTEDSAGILPRTIDVIFNSIEGLQGDDRYRPVRLQGVELADPSDSQPPPPLLEPTVVRVLGNQMTTPKSFIDMGADDTVVKLDRNYEYTIWISYAEVYNEKVYDLLETVKNQPDENESFLPRSGSATSLVLTRTALPLKPSPSTDSAGSGISGKYIHGLRQFRVASAAEAKALVKLGQIHRRVFGTLANRESSRSHGMVIVKVMRCHRGEKNDLTAIQVSRLTLVDLAGSERTKHTHTTGDRLKEAGNINKSLMVLGQCLEVLRQNQRKLAMSLSHEGEGHEGRMDTREVKKGLAIVPFRHSKLTEALMDYFVGDGQTVMIVNVNPYDTGYDENSHVMKFSALAREVYVNPAPAPVQRVPVVGPGKAQGRTIKRLGPMTLKDPAIVPNALRRKVTISTGGPGSGKKMSEQTLEVLEVDEADEENNDEGDDDSPINPLVDALFDEIEDLRMQLYDSEMRCALIEAETREEVMREMEERMQEMERMYTRRLMKEVEQNEVKTDAKIDMLHQSGLFASPVKKRQLQVDSDDESEEGEDDEMSLIEQDGEESDSGSDEEMFKHAKHPQRIRSLASQEIREIRKFVPDPPMLPSDNEEAVTSDGETEDTSSVNPSDDELVDRDSADESEEDAEEDDEWVPSLPTPRAKVVPRHSSSSPTRPKGNNQQTRVSNLTKGLNDLMLEDEVGEEDSMFIMPKRGSSASGTMKKKRNLSMAPVYREAEIEQAAQRSGKWAGKAMGSNVRRFA
ncbi:hypothetical protein E1B28_000834 [Marasmius oreades]|uniref:Kinesin-like protein n=1 Tax=Marasmius oreades TaxID=181124 RepID=A0A9P7V291_9AGAR|nr:uncharacterized protein E1B28_000834 [Marasmius oreades]KAG7098944.1 hypothetical protein E1B28_000834 [Marasmius oreades]